MEDAFARFQADLASVGQAGASTSQTYAAPPPPAPASMPMSAPMAPPPMFPPPAAPYSDFQAAYPYYSTDYASAYPTDYASAYADPAYAGMAQAQAQAYPSATTAAPAVVSSAPVPSRVAPPVGQGAQVASVKNQEKEEKKAAAQKKGKVREAAGKRWRDPTLDEWPDNDHRIFVGDLGNDCNDDALSKAFQKYPSFVKAKIVRDKRTKKTKGYGFVSFMDSNDFAKAIREMNGKYIGNRPCKLRKSSWDERNAHFGKKQKR